MQAHHLDSGSVKDDLNPVRERRVQLEFHLMDIRATSVHFVIPDIHADAIFQQPRDVVLLFEIHIGVSPHMDRHRSLLPAKMDVIDLRVVEHAVLADETIHLVDAADEAVKVVDEAGE